MMRIVALLLLLAITATGWLAYDQQHRRTVAARAAAAELDAVPASGAPMPAPAPSSAVALVPPSALPPRSPRPIPAAVPSAPAATPVDAPALRCDGRTHCSQMHSCDEARYFLAHCPGVKMDGNHDGEPCEQQFPECGS